MKMLMVLLLLTGQTLMGSFLGKELILAGLICCYFMAWPASTLGSFVLSGCMLDTLSWSLIILSLYVSIFMLQVIEGGSTPNKLMFLYLLIFLQLILYLCFSVSSLLLFYMMFELSLIPILLMILGWGYQMERLNASLALMMYTVCASLPLLLLLVFYITNNLSSTMDLLLLNPSKSPSVTLLFIAGFAGFLVKFPMFLVHLWLPKAHVEAPVAGSMVLAALLLKLGGYGAWRISECFPIMSSQYIVLPVALMGGAQMAILCIMQMDMKVMIAYSSVSHMSLVIGGLMTGSYVGFWAALMMMIAHGVSSSSMFMGANIFYTLYHSRAMTLMAGMLVFAPMISLFWFLSCLSMMGAPPTSNLLAEIWSIIALLNTSNYLMMPVALCCFFAAVYSLIIYANPNQNQVSNVGCFSQSVSISMVIPFISHSVMFILCALFFI